MTKTCIHTIVTPTIDYETEFDLETGDHIHIINGSRIDGNPASIAGYEYLIDTLVGETRLYDRDEFWSDLTFVIDSDNKVTIKNENDSIISE
jgi:hypothetical protein